MGFSRNRYGAWRGGPDPLAPPYDVRAAVDEVGADVLAGGSLRDALRGADPATDPEANRRLKEMLHDLNDLLGRHSRGEDTADAFAQFMQRHGEFFPEQPQSVDELVDALARRAAAGERLMRSLSR